MSCFNESSSSSPSPFGNDCKEEKVRSRILLLVSSMSSFYLVSSITNTVYDTLTIIPSSFKRMMMIMVWEK